MGDAVGYQEVLILELTFNILYTTRSVYNLTLYPTDFLKFVNFNLTRVVEDLQNLNLPVTGSELAIKETPSNPIYVPGTSLLQHYFSHHCSRWNIDACAELDAIDAAPFCHALQCTIKRTFEGSFNRALRNAIVDTNECTETTSCERPLDDCFGSIARVCVWRGCVSGHHECLHFIL